MANYCCFDILIRGRRGNAVLLCNSIAATSVGSVCHTSGTDESYEIRFRGVCEWSVHFAVSDEWDGADIDTDLNTLPERLLAEVGPNYRHYSLRAKSRVLACDVRVRQWSEESGFDHFEHFAAGKRLRLRRIDYSPDTVFDWERMEYVGHECETGYPENGETNALTLALLSASHYARQQMTAVMADHPGDENQGLHAVAGEPMQLDMQLEPQALREMFPLTADDGDLVIQGLWEQQSVLLEADHFDLSEDVRLLLPAGFACQRTTSPDGKDFHTILAGKYAADEIELHRLSLTPSVAEGGDPDALIQEKCAQEASFRFIRLCSPVPVAIHLTREEEIAFMGSSLSPTLLEVDVFAGGKHVSLSSATISRNGRLHPEIFTTLAELLMNLRVNGQPLDLDGWTAQDIALQLYPELQQSLDVSWAFFSGSVHQHAGWRMAIPDGFVPHLAQPESEELYFLPASCAEGTNPADAPAFIHVKPMQDAAFPDDGAGFLTPGARTGLLQTAAVRLGEIQAECNALNDLDAPALHIVENDRAGVLFLFTAGDEGSIAHGFAFTRRQALQIEMSISDPEDRPDHLAHFNVFDHILRSFAFTDDAWLPDESLIGKPECLARLLNHDESLLSSAVEQLMAQYDQASLGAKQYLDYFCRHEIELDASIRALALKLLRAVAEVKADCVRQAEVFLQQLRAAAPEKALLLLACRRLIGLEKAFEQYRMLPPSQGFFDDAMQAMSTSDTDLVTAREPLSLKRRIAALRAELDALEQPAP